MATMTPRAISEPDAATLRTVLGREVRLPVEVRDATAAVAYYLVPAAAAQRLISLSGLTVARFLPGRTLCTIGAMDYKDNDLGAYREIAVTFFVREGGRDAGPLATLPDFLRGRLSAYIHQLPVDDEFSCEAGRLIWGFPKFVTQIDLSRSGGAQTATLSAEGRHVLTQRVRSGGRRTLPQRTQVSFAFRDGTLYRTPSLMNGERMGFRLGGAALELGSHEMADELRSLGLPKRPLFSTWIGRMRARFDAPEVIR